jgi:hypothetical protein
MIIREIIQRVSTLYSKGVRSDDSRLSSRYIYNKALSVRALLLSQKSNKKQTISQWNYQTLPCVEMVEIPIIECPCLPPIGCKILKSKYKIPNPLSNLNNILIQSVTSLDGSIIYSQIGWVEKKYKSANKYTGNKPDYFIKDDYLYITHRYGPKVLTIIGIFEDPLKAYDYPSFCTDCEDCLDCVSILDKDFPIDAQMVDNLIELVVQECIEGFSKGREDKSNDSSDSLMQESK